MRQLAISAWDRSGRWGIAIIHRNGVFSLQKLCVDGLGEGIPSLILADHPWSAPRCNLGLQSAQGKTPKRPSARIVAVDYGLHAFEFFMR